MLSCLSCLICPVCHSWTKIYMCSARYFSYGIVWLRITWTYRGSKRLQDVDVGLRPVFHYLYNFILSCLLVFDISVSKNDTSMRPSINQSINAQSQPFWTLLAVKHRLVHYHAVTLWFHLSLQHDTLFNLPLVSAGKIINKLPGGETNFVAATT
jgi:hypothetical protein